MPDHKDLDLTSLMDLLVKFTREYDEMLSTRVFSEEEFAQCKNTLAEIHATIKEKAKEEGYDTDDIFPNIPDMRSIRRRAEEPSPGLGRHNQQNGTT